MLIPRSGSRHKVTGVRARIRGRPHGTHMSVACLARDADKDGREKDAQISGGGAKSVVDVKLPSWPR